MIADLKDMIGSTFARDFVECLVEGDVEAAILYIG
jgi:hypothetical protein